MQDSRQLKRERFSPVTYCLLGAALFLTMVLCICVGSVRITFSDTVTAVWNAVWGLPIPENIAKNIILNVRLPRVLCVALAGAALSICGAAMQGLLRNPLADGSTMGVSSGAALGAVIAMATGFTLPGTSYGGIMVTAMAFAFGSLVLILSLAYMLDRSLSTSSIILIGVIFTMFISSIISLVITFSSDHTRSLNFWTLGSFSGVNYSQVKLLGLALLVCGGVLYRFSPELNAFAIGEDNARHIGVNVKRVKLVILITVSVLIGVCVSISGTISFVGLVMPHIARMLVGPNHRRLLPASLFSGAIFLLLADLTARTILSPIELSIGVVTSIVGAVAFVVIFCKTRKAG
ncbi:MAG: iron ABC transporter permease [Clostridia bacterium]|jgi:iron complex transport system permease protein|nr:iron ABC transporter permease [Clostridia bacterium]